jgi:hypothetical protein
MVGSRRGQSTGTIEGVGKVPTASEGQKTGQALTGAETKAPIGKGQMEQKVNRVQVFLEKCKSKGLLPVYLSRNRLAGPGVAIGRYRRLYYVGVPGTCPGIGRLSRREAISEVYESGALWGLVETFEPGFSKFKPRNHSKLARLHRAMKEWNAIIEKYH